LLLKHEFSVWLIDEYNTSKQCPLCRQPSLLTFRQALNPQPYRRTRMPAATHHSAPFLCSLFLCSFSCTNLNCSENMDLSQVNYRLWSQDLAVALNFRHILNHLSHTVRIPERLAEIIKIGRTRR
ncbi:hypothetical protein F4703DRAFT_1735686, partial [Phycomyces blakesleeanus]